MEQPTVKPQITNMGIMNAAPKVAPSKEQLQNYLDNPPAGKNHCIFVYFKFSCFLKFSENL